MCTHIAHTHFDPLSPFFSHTWHATSRHRDNGDLDENIYMSQLPARGDGATRLPRLQVEEEPIRPQESSIATSSILATSSQIKPMYVHQTIGRHVPDLPDPVCHYMLIAGSNQDEIGRLKWSLHDKFWMKELRQAYHILGMRIERN